MDNPFSTIDQRLEGIEHSLRLILESKAIISPTPLQNPTPVDHKFSILELSKYLGVNMSTVHRYKANGVIPFYKAGRTIFFKKSEVDAAMSSIQVKSKKGGSIK